MRENRNFNRNENNILIWDNPENKIKNRIERMKNNDFVWQGLDLEPIYLFLFFSFTAKIRLARAIRKNSRAEH